MLLGTSIAAGGKGIHEKINSPRRWQKMASSRRQKTTRLELLGKLGDMMHMSRRSVRDGYLSMVSILAEKEALSYARDLSLDPDQLTLLIHDRVKATAVTKHLAAEKKEEEKREKIKAKKAAPPEKKVEEVQKQEPDAGRSPETAAQCPPPPPEPEKGSKAGGKQSTLF
jgi:replication factor C large subunit